MPPTIRKSPSRRAACWTGPSLATAGKPVVFDAAKSTDSAGKKLYFRWDLDDGTPARGRPASRMPSRMLAFTASASP